MAFPTKVFALIYFTALPSDIHFSSKKSLDCDIGLIICPYRESHSKMDLFEISLITSIWIIGIFGISFFVLVYVSYTKKRKILMNGLGDEEILRDMKKKYRQFFYDRWLISRKNSAIPLYTISNSPTLIRAKNTSMKLDESQSLRKALEKRKGKISKGCLVGIIICSIMIAVCGISALAGIFYHVTNEPLRFDGVDYWIIRDDGMSDESKEINLRKESLAGFTKEDFSSLAEGDVIAYYDAERSYVSIKYISSIDDADGRKVSCKNYKDDSISENDADITQDRYLGKFNGYSNYGWGITLGYVESNFGIVTLCLVSVAVYFFAYCFASIDLAYRDREYYLSQAVDEDDEKRYVEEIGRLNNSVEM